MNSLVKSFAFRRLVNTSVCYKYNSMKRFSSDRDRNNNDSCEDYKQDSKDHEPPCPRDRLVDSCEDYGKDDPGGEGGGQGPKGQQGKKGAQKGGKAQGQKGAQEPCKEYGGGIFGGAGGPNKLYILIGAALGVALLALAFFKSRRKKDSSGQASGGGGGAAFLGGDSSKKGIPTGDLGGNYVDGLPLYTLAEVSKHTTKENRIWITFRRGVYDITDFIYRHPGGELILAGAGTGVDPFWYVYQSHYYPDVIEVLESFRIGNLSEAEAKVAMQGMTDPYNNEPKRNSLMQPVFVQPYNAGPPLPVLVENFITPNDLLYVRTHMATPDLDPKTYKFVLEIEGTGKTITYTLDDLKKMPKHTITASLICAGIRRTDMTKVKPLKGLLLWPPNAIGCGVWTGVRLRDLLLAAGVDEDSVKYKHVQFEGYDEDYVNNPYGASIPFWKGMDKRGDVLVAYEMNGQPLTRDHGYPARIVVPGVAGARSVKWLSRIVVSENPSELEWQNVYRAFSKNVVWGKMDLQKAPPIQHYPVTSAICVPTEGQTVKVVDGHILVKGYAWSGGGNKIVRVDVTVNGGQEWHIANFDGQDTAEQPQHWGWTLWSVKVPVSPGTEEVEIWAKAVDSSYNTQPESFDNIWNLRGITGTAYHKVPVKCA